MSSIPYLAGIYIFPIKSLDGIALDQATVLESGALQHDREFALVDAEGKFINGKRTAKVHEIRSKFDLTTWTVSLQLQETSSAETFHLEADRPALNAWFSEYFGFPVTLIQNVDGGFPDDTASPGPTVISTATLTEVTSWFPGLTLEDVRRRFRTNLEIADLEPFGEDRFYEEVNRVVEFQIGDVQLQGVNPCQRCVVVTRAAETGQPYPNFQKTFATKRKDTLPEWAERSRFNHFYRLAVNTRLLPSQGRMVLRLGDEVRLG